MSPQVSPTSLPTRRELQDRRRAAEAAELAARRGRLRRAVTGRPAVTLGLAGALVVGVPGAGLALGVATPASAATATAAQEPITAVLARGDGAAEDASGLTLDAVGAARARVVASSLETAPAACAPARAANGVAAGMASASTDAEVHAPLAEGTFEVTSQFGTRVHPIFGVSRQHDGTDFSAPAGTPIHAVAAGTVVHAGPNIGQPGTLVVVEHDLDGEIWTTWYLHMYAEDIAVTEGQQVAAGDLVGLVGSAGNSTGPHLHLEVHEGPGTGGPAVDPLPWLTEHGAGATDC